MDDQINLHTNPLSKEGLATAVVEISTDMKWVKDMLQKLDAKIDESNERLEEMMKKFREEQDERLQDHENRIRRLERDKNWLWGAIAGLGAAITLIGYIISMIKGG